MRNLFIAAASVALLLLGATAGAQMPRQPEPPPGRGPANLPTLPQGLLPGAQPTAVPVAPDTARVELAWAEGSTLPTGIAMVPSPVGFGDVVGLVLRYPAQAEPPRPAVESPADWLEFPLRVAKEHTDALRAQSAVAGGQGADERSVVIPVRIYRADPFVLTAGDVSSPVIEVRGRTTDLAQTAAIRPPRARGWNLLVILALAVSIVLLGALAAALWRRRRAPQPIGDWAPAGPGWLTAAVRLDELLAGRELDRGEGREVLNRLAAIARGFAADRYRIAAREMTGAEIVEACRLRGFPLDPVRGVARLIDAADRRRYDPDPVSAAWVRRSLAELVGWMDRAKIEPRHTPVAAAELLAAERAWAQLQRFAAQERQVGEPAVPREAS